MDKSRILENISNLLLENKIEEARATIQNEYPHKHIELEKRSYTLKEKHCFSLTGNGQLKYKNQDTTSTYLINSSISYSYTF